ncbi:MAG: hypothetical protein H6736_09455 [Alphaproteobacteria bacterium]|nr:hypothetical protein [Alphaproteobacteria bacterium]MCB9692028.1 hypothetical protein [Alphaproteobacteria bacterium]
MDRGALIGGGAVLAALGAVGLFYMVLSSGETGDVADYQRQKPGVESLHDRSGGPVTLAGTTEEAGKEEGKRDGMAEAMTMRKHEIDPADAAKWAQKRAEARVRDERMAGEQLQDFFKDHDYPEDRQKQIWELFNSNFELRNTIREEIESGRVSPRVGRKRLEQQREEMKTALVAQVGDEGYTELQQRMDKIRVVLF